MNFDKDPVGKLPAGWKAAGPMPAGGATAWSVAADPTAPSSPNVLELTTPGTDPSGFNLCYAQQHSMKDVDLTAKLRANGGKTAQGGLVAFRIKSPDTYYACGIDPQEGKLHVYKVMDGKSSDLKTVDFKGAGPGGSTWYTVRARMIGDTITCWVDGREMATATDSAIKEAGHIGVATRSDATTSFDDVKAIKVGGEGKDETKRPPDAPKPSPKPGG
jgi:hypothetical protein